MSRFRNETISIWLISLVMYICDIIILPTLVTTHFDDMKGYLGIHSLASNFLNYANSLQTLHPPTFSLPSFYPSLHISISLSHCILLPLSFSISLSLSLSLSLSFCFFSFVSRFTPVCPMMSRYVFLSFFPLPYCLIHSLSVSYTPSMSHILPLCLIYSPSVSYTPPMGLIHSPAVS